MRVKDSSAAQSVLLDPEYTHRIALISARHDKRPIEEIASDVAETALAMNLDSFKQPDGVSFEDALRRYAATCILRRLSQEAARERQRPRSRVASLDAIMEEAGDFTVESTPTHQSRAYEKVRWQLSKSLAVEARQLSRILDAAETFRSLETALCYLEVTNAQFARLCGWAQRNIPVRS